MNRQHDVITVLGEKNNIKKYESGLVDVIIRLLLLNYYRLEAFVSAEQRVHL